mgnify:CR=1 FL=1
MKQKNRQKIALISVFASLYAVFGLWPLFPVVGAAGKNITVAAIMAPLVGVMLGPYIGVLTVLMGGIVGLSMAQMGPFGPLSFLTGVAAAFCSGMLYERRRVICAVVYLTLLLIFAFYPVVGPAWLCPYFMWFQVVGFVVLVSPLQSKAVKCIRRNPNSFGGLTFGAATTFFVATLFSHLVGSIMFEAFYWPTIIPAVETWRGNWQIITFIYPTERIVITIATALIGTALIKALKTHGFENLLK